MKKSHAQPQARIEARIVPDVLAAVKHVAEIQGRSASDLMTVAREVVERTIKEAQIIRLSLADQQKVADALVHPQAPNAALKRAFAVHRKMITGS